MKIRSITIIFFLAFSFVLRFSQTVQKNDEVLATVGSYEITLRKFLDRYEDYLIFTGVQDNMQLRFAILNNMINEILLHNYDDNTKVLNNPEYKKEIEWAKKETILAFLKDREIYAKITVTDAEMREAFKRSNIKLAVRHLYAHTEKEAERLYDLLKAGAHFKDLAKQVFTDTALRNNGGYLGYITWGDTDPNFEDAAYSLKVGEISRPVKTAQGYSIIRVDKRIVNPLMTENEYLNMKHKLERGIKISKKKPYEDAYLAKIFGENKIKFYDKSIENIFNDIHSAGKGDIELNRSGKNLSDKCVEYQGKTYSQSEIERILDESPAYNIEKLTDTKKVKTAILGLLMQEKLLAIAHEKGYDTTFDVNSTFSQLSNNIYLNYKRKEVLDKVDVSDSELYKYYNDNIGYYTTEKEIDVQEIVLRDSKTIDLVKSKLSAGKDFGTLAEKYSLRKWSAENKGELGLSPYSKFGELKDTLWNSEIGKVIGPIKFDKYFGFFRVLSKQDGKTVDFNLVKKQILKNVRNEKGFPYMKKHLEYLSKKVNIKVNDDLLKNYNLNLAG